VARRLGVEVPWAHDAEPAAQSPAAPQPAWASR
jgi:hypothetical protein